MKQMFVWCAALLATVVLASTSARAQGSDLFSGFASKPWGNSSVSGDDNSRPQPSSARSNRRANRTSVNRSPSTRRSTRRSTTPASLTGGTGGTVGIASYYWQPQRVASGGWFNPNALTAAHKTLPFGTRVRVTSLATGRSVVVKINDRGPYIKGRIIDLSRRAAGVIGMQGAGITRVRMVVLGR